MGDFIMALLRMILLTSIFFSTLIWVIITGKIFFDNLRKEKTVLDSLNKEMINLRAELTLFKKDIEDLKKKIVDKS